MTTFDTTLHTKDAEDIIPVSVSYEMRDLGVMGRHNENVQPVIIEALHYGGYPHGFLNILRGLSDAQIEALEQAARRHQRELSAAKESSFTKD